MKGQSYNRPYLDKERNVYTVNGRDYYRLSSVVEQVPNAGLRAWKKRVGEGEAKRIAEETSEWGTAVHEITMHQDEEYGKEVERMLDADEGLLIPLLSWNSWTGECIQKWYATEEMVWADELQVAGTIDRVAKMKGDRCRTIVDIKTGTLRDEIGIRLFGYRLMWNERHPRQKVDRCIAVNLPRQQPGDLKVREYIDNDKTRYTEKFVQLAKDYRALMGV